MNPLIINLSEIDFINSKLNDITEPQDQKEYWKEDLINIKENPKIYWAAFDLTFSMNDEDSRDRVNEIEFMQQYYNKDNQHIDNLSKARNPCKFSKGDTVTDIYDSKMYQVIEPDKRGMAKFKNIDNGLLVNWNSCNNRRFILNEKPVSSNYSNVAPLANKHGQLSLF